MIIGLTGRYCAGKSWVGTFFEQKGFAIIEVDNLGHTALSDSTNQLLATFGEQILNEDKSINRKALGKIVFSDKEKLKELEAIVHPKMVKATQSLIEKYREEKYKGIVINAALLQRMDLVKLCDKVCYVATPSIIRLKRAIKRDNASLKAFLRVEKAQTDIRVANLRVESCPYIIHNWLSKSFNYRQVEKFYATINS